MKEYCNYRKWYCTLLKILKKDNEPLLRYDMFAFGFL